MSTGNGRREKVGRKPNRMSQQDFNLILQKTPAAKEISAAGGYRGGNAADALALILCDKKDQGKKSLPRHRAAI